MLPELATVPVFVITSGHHPLGAIMCMLAAQARGRAQSRRPTADRSQGQWALAVSVARLRLSSYICLCTLTSVSERDNPRRSAKHTGSRRLPGLEELVTVHYHDWNSQQRGFQGDWVAELVVQGKPE
eukprot:621012-Rhodomonas_salina.5